MEALEEEEEDEEDSRVYDECKTDLDIPTYPLPIYSSFQSL